MRTKKAQHLTLTTIFILFIFFLALTLFFDELFINPRMDGQRHQHLQREASRAMNALASEGYPADWNSSTVQRAGLLTNGVYNKTKAEQLESMHYDETKEYLGIINNYFLNITNDGSTTIIGEAEYTSEQALLASNPRYLATQTRTVTSTTGIATMTIHVYRGIP